MMLGAFYVKSAYNHLPESMSQQRKYSDSWLHFFAVVSSMMRRGFPSLEVEFELAPEEKRCVQRTMPVILKEIDQVGPAVILNMFKTYPLSMIYFAAFRNLLFQDIKPDNEDLVRHGKLFVKVRFMLRKNILMVLSHTYLCEKSPTK